MKILINSKIFGVLTIPVSLFLILSCFEDARDNTVNFSDASEKIIKNTDFSTLSSFAYSEDGSNALNNISKKLSSYTKTNFNITIANNIKGYSSYKIEGSQSATLEIDANKNVLVFNKKLESYSGNNNTLGLPSEATAASIAKSHLNTLNLFPNTDEKDQLEITHVGGLSMAAVDAASGKSEIYEKLKTVTYSRKLLGLPVMGASRIVVNMGTNGELTGLVYNWPKIQKNNLSTGSLLVKSDIKSHVANIIKSIYANSSGNSITINKLELVMFDDGDGVIEPALYARGNVSNVGSTKDESDWIIPILENSKGKYPYSEKPAVMPTMPQMN